MHSHPDCSDSLGGSRSLGGFDTRRRRVLQLADPAQPILASAIDQHVARQNQMVFPQWGRPIHMICGRMAGDDKRCWVICQMSAISNWKRDSRAPGDSHSRNLPLFSGISRPLDREVTVTFRTGESSGSVCEAVACDTVT
ncbi:hypothetical protein KFU94_68470 [Chloroflexi bacterium TSY]|nr:hypothetical protein [Chloroflexi bacterium TSY]